MLSMTARSEYIEAVKRLKEMGAETQEEMIAILAHQVRIQDKKLDEFREINEYRKPIPNNWIHRIDCGTDMMECPKCSCRIIGKWFSYAVGDRGYGFCPYCGEDVRKKTELSKGFVDSLFEESKKEGNDE